MSIHQSLNNEPERQIKETPCRTNIDIFDSSYLTAFDPDDYIEDYEGEEAPTPEEIHLAQFKHNIAQKNAEKAAIDLCHTCPIRLQCASWVLSTEGEGESVYGVVGGMTEIARAKRLHPVSVTEEYLSTAV